MKDELINEVLEKENLILKENIQNKLTENKKLKEETKRLKEENKKLKEENQEVLQLLDNAKKRLNKIYNSKMYRIYKKLKQLVKIK
jgi:F0F1-type ATP synthase membrane subunit b/b'